MRIRTRLILLLLALTSRGLTAQARDVVPIDFDWHFSHGDPVAAQTPAFDDSRWRTLDLPHDWSIEGESRQDNPAGGAQAYLPCGIGWYRRAIDVPREWAGKLVRVEFDAVQRNSDVWINGQHLGNRPYGFISFAYDLTPHLKAGERNVLAVRVDNSQVPSARWYTGSGIYAHVRLVVCDSVHIPQWGVFVTTPKVTDESAEVHAATNVENASSSASRVRLVSELRDEADRAVATAEENVELAPAQTRTLEQTLRIERPQRWSNESPHLYRFVSRIYRDDQLLDESNTPFGVRTIRFDASTGFWLNNKNVKLRGLAMHYDAAGACGSAIPDALLEQRILALKAIGCNAIRTGHTPFPPLFYDLCDRHGMMVLDEAFDGWRKKRPYDYGALYFNDWWRRDFTDWVRRDRNHPSIILWSIGNETGNTDKFGITNLAHELDPTRLTTGGQCSIGVDVAGFNGPGEQPGVLDKYRAAHPDQPILLTEAPHGYQTRGFYRTLTWWRNPKAPHFTFPPYSDVEIFPRGGDEQYCSSYDNATLYMTNRQCWLRTRDTPWISGQFRWVAFDYLGEADWGGRHWPARYWHPGIFDSAGFPKDTAFFYQSQWTIEPMVHLLPHWSHPLVERGTKIPVVAYSNCDEVELLLNGQSLGRQKQREGLADFLWQVPYEPGELKAIAYRGDYPVAEASFHTASDPARIKLTSDRIDLKADRRDVATVTCAVTDDAGELVPWADDRVEFRLSGDGARLMGYENGNPVDLTAHRASYRNVFAGLGRGFFQATDKAGPVELTAAAILGRRPFQGSVRVTLATARLALRGPLPDATFDIRYTTDGTEPTSASPRYDQPLTLERATSVRMLVLRDGQPWLSSSSQFEAGLPPVITDPRYEMPTATRPTSGSSETAE